MPYQGKKINIMKESLFGTKLKQVFRNYLALPTLKGSLKISKVHRTL